MSHAEKSFLCSCDVSLVPLLHDFSRTVWSVYSRRCIFFFCNLFSPHYELFETQTQFIVVTKELRVCWDLIQKDLRHLQRALKQRGGERRDKNKDTGSDRQRKQKTGGEKERQASFGLENGFLIERSMLPRTGTLHHNIRTILDQRRRHHLPPVWLMLPPSLHTSTICLQFTLYELSWPIFIIKPQYACPVPESRQTSVKQPWLT